MMAERQKYKARFTSKLPNGDFLGLTVWPGKSDPNAEVLTIQIRRQGSAGWETLHRGAIYRTSDGRYSLLPDRTPASQPANNDPAGSNEASELFEEPLLRSPQGYNTWPDKLGVPCELGS